MKLFIRGKVRKCKVIPALKGCYYWNEGDGGLIIPTLLAVAVDKDRNKRSGYTIYDISVSKTFREIKYLDKIAYQDDIVSMAKKYAERYELDWADVVKEYSRVLKENETIILSNV